MLQAVNFSHFSNAVLRTDSLTHFDVMTLIFLCMGLNLSPVAVKIICDLQVYSWRIIKINSLLDIVLDDNSHNSNIIV